MSGLHKFKPKKIGLLTPLIIFCIVLTSEKIHAIPFDGQITTSGFQIKDTLPKGQRQSLNVNQQLSNINRTATTNNQQLSNPDTDTIPQRGNDSLITTQQTDTFSFKIAKDTMDAPVEYQAADSAVLLVKEQKFILYGKTETKYKDVVISAPQTILDQQTNVLTALSEKDSLGRMITRAKFQQGDQMFESESFTYNFKSQKGITKNTYTKDGEFFIKANVSKKIDANTIFIKEGYFTTCNLDDPHFAFKTNKMKVISGQFAVSGPTHPEFEGIPIPLYLPFGLFPLSPGRHSGLLAPQFTSNQQMGLGLEGLGYYHVLNDYIDVTLRTSIYSYGGYNINIIPQYRKRYRYNGSFNLAYSRTKFAFKGDPDYQLIKAFQIGWNHSMDSRARPGTTFSASVNAGSTQFNQYVPNNPYKNFQNQLYSSITYSKQWQGKPYSLQLSANHNQNNSTRLINIILPDAGFTVSTIFPLQRKEIVGAPKWYEKLGIGYSGVARNQLSFYDTAGVTFGKILDTMRWGAQHRFPLSIQVPPLGNNLFLNPFINYEETWYTKQVIRAWNDTAKKVDTVATKKGFFRDQQLSFGLSFNTNIYGMYEFGKNSYVKAIRHVMRPTISFNYKPNISKRSFNVIQTDTFGTRRPLPQFEDNLFPAYSYGTYGGLSFGIDNNLEMKVRGKNDTIDKKIRLIDGFGFSSGYNFLADSLKLQPFSLYLRSTLFEKLSISAQAQLDPYEVGPTGQPINRFVWSGGRFTPGRFTGGSISASTSFQSKPRDEKKALQDSLNRVVDPALLGDQQQLMDYMQRNPAEFVDFNIPWSINLSFSLAVNRTLKPDYSGFITNTTSSMSFNNSFNLTPKWNFSTNGFFDFNTRQLQMFTMSIAREMHCWQMAISVTPIGAYQYFNITISPKSPVLRDLRVNRTRHFYNY